MGKDQVLFYNFGHNLSKSHQEPEVTKLNSHFIDIYSGYPTNINCRPYLFVPVNIVLDVCVSLSLRVSSLFFILPSSTQLFLEQKEVDFKVHFSGDTKCILCADEVYDTAWVLDLFFCDFIFDSVPSFTLWYIVCFLCGIATKMYPESLM